MEYSNGLRITDDAALQCVKAAAGTVRVEIEALLSMGLANTPMSGARIGVSSGNFVTARPLGVRNGIDYYTGEVRRIDGQPSATLAERRISRSRHWAIRRPASVQPECRRNCHPHGHRTAR
jgi:acetylglutamate kinase